MQPDRTRTALHLALDELLSTNLLILKELPAVNEYVVDVAKCTYEGVQAVFSGWDATTARAVAQAAYECVDYELAYEMITEGIASESVGDAAEAAAALNRFREVVKWLHYGELAVNGIDGAVWGHFDYPLIRVDHQAAKPTRDSLGRPVVDRCLSPDPVKTMQWRIDMACQNAEFARHDTPGGGGGDTGLPAGKIVQTSDHRSYLYETDDKVLRHIPDGNTYICLAKHYMVDFEVSNDLEPYRSLANVGPEIAAAATCDDNLAPTRNISPATVDSGTVLRESSGTAWVINADQRFHIPSEQEFSCWVNPTFDANIEFDGWDYVTTEELSLFPERDGLVSNCGDPTNPGF